jgi:hypothetical protein
VHDGVALPTEILEQVCYKNAERLFGASVEGWQPPAPPYWTANEAE